MEKGASKKKSLPKMKRQFTAGGVVFKKIQSPRKTKVLWLVTKSNPSEEYPLDIWRLPKGWIDDEDGGKNPGPLTRGEGKITEEILQKTALREVQEEGGVDAKIIKRIGNERFFFKHENELILKFVTYFSMEYVSDLAQGFGFETSEVAWLDYVEARKRLKYPSEKRVLDKAKALLDSGLQENLI